MASKNMQISAGIADSPCRLDAEAASRFQRFEEDSGRIFSHEKFDVGVYQISPNDGFEERIAEDEASFTQILQSNRQNTWILYLLRQNNSWSRLNISMKAFRELVKRHDICPSFLDCVQAFGHKTEEDSRIWDGFQGCIEKNTSNPVAYLCYTFRYIEKKSGNSKRSWVIRQTGVYQKINLATGYSRSVMLQPSQRLSESLHAILANSAPVSHGLVTAPAHVHRLVLAMALHHVGDYAEHLHSELTQMNYKACFSVVGTVKAVDFPVTFADMQKMHLLRQKVARLLSILESFHSTVCSIEAHSIRLNKERAESVSFETLQGFEMSKAQALTYIRRVEWITKFSDGISALLEGILRCRHDQVLLQTNVASHHNLGLIRQLALDTREESRMLAKISRQSQEDSKAVKGLTIIATMYLPASLIATIFSSSLIQTSSTHANVGEDDHFRAHRDIWVYAVISVGLMAITALLVLWIQGKFVWGTQKPSQINGMRADHP